MNQFIKQHQSRVRGMLCGWDRIRFRGTLRVLAVVPGLFTWLNEQGVLLKEFKGFALELTERMKTSVEAMATAAGRKIEYLASSALSKEALVQELLRREKIQEGIVCVFSCVESAQVGRWLRLFKEHGLIHKIPGTHRYQLSKQGLLLLPAIINARQANTQKLQQVVT